jgi:hypothetical protein
MFDDITIEDVYTKIRDKYGGIYDVSLEGARVIITQRGNFRCFISRAYDVKKRQKVLSAHVLHLSADSTPRLEYWNVPDIEHEENAILTLILQDLQSDST